MQPSNNRSPMDIYWLVGQDTWEKNSEFPQYSSVGVNPLTLAFSLLQKLSHILDDFPYSPHLSV